MSTSFVNKFCIGLTGGIGCGKTTIANLFAERGVSIVDTDCIAHQLTAAKGLAIPAIREQFGADFLTTADAMDRTKMREHVFAHPAEKKRLEAILHPMIQQESLRLARQSNGDYVIFVVPLLLESDTFRQYISRILVIDCSEERQIQRVMKRNGWSEQQVRAVMQTQVSRDVRLAAADDVITNENDIHANDQTLLQQVSQLHTAYLVLAKNMTQTQM